MVWLAVQGAPMEEHVRIVRNECFREDSPCREPCKVSFSPGYFSFFSRSPTATLPNIRTRMSVFVNLRNPFTSPLSQKARSNDTDKLNTIWDSRDNPVGKCGKVESDDYTHGNPHGTTVASIRFSHPLTTRDADWSEKTKKMKKKIFTCPRICLLPPLGSRRWE